MWSDQVAYGVLEWELGVCILARPPYHRFMCKTSVRTSRPTDELLFSSFRFINLSRVPGFLRGFVSFDFCSHVGGTFINLIAQKNIFSWFLTWVPSREDSSLKCSRSLLCLHEPRI